MQSRTIFEFEANEEDLEFDQTIPSQDSFNSVCTFDDEIDAALEPDFRVRRMMNEIADVEMEEDPYFDDVEEYEDIDITNDDIEDPTEEDLDAEELAKAEKEVLDNPFEEDEVIDIAIGDSNANSLED